MPFIQRGPTHDIPYLDIRLDNDVLTFRGSPSEAVGTVVNGHVALCVREPTTVRSVTMVLQGVKRLHWHDRTPPVSGLMASSNKPVKYEHIFYEKHWTFIEGSQHGYTLAPNNYVYPFSTPLEGTMEESVEGLGNTHVIYRFKVKVTRGKFNHDITAKKHLRIIRTLAPTALELTQTMSVENIWPNKVEYSISIPSKAVVFGTSIPINIVLVPLLKGLTIGKVICQMKQTQTFTIPAPKNLTHTEQKHILGQTFDTGRLEEEGDEDFGRWVMQERITLPKSLNNCVQDCELEGIKIRHKLKFVIQLHNPDGHMSELRASLPVMLFISPSYLMNLDGRMPNENESEFGTESELVNAPPTYDEHYLDRLYNDISHDHFETPLPSGANTPGILSRSNSSEDLHSMATAPLHLPDANSRRWNGRNSGPNTPGTSIHPSTHAASSTSSIDHPALDYFPSTSSTPHTRSGESSRAPSPDSSSSDDIIDLNRLNKVPSYTTAVSSNPRNLSDPNAAALPSYDTCGSSIASAPTSPQNSPPSSHGFLSRPRLPGRTNTGGILRSGFRSHTSSATSTPRSSSDMGPRTHSHLHLHSLGDLLEGSRG
ncbi:hypothetical protein EDC01DRAFT_377124 [Geopyxis carbonaria]|nr:hypothetical protein EDC01DRAFT_377124 [Geopyxis carbonaria]